jgi:hypothetical protein
VSSTSTLGLPLQLTSSAVTKWYPYGDPIRAQGTLSQRSTTVRPSSTPRLYSYCGESIQIDILNIWHLNNAWPVAVGGFKHAIVISDAFSKFFNYILIKNMDTLWKHIESIDILCRNDGNPVSHMQFDSQFKSLESVAYLESQHITYNTTPPHEHQFNGRIERANRTIQDRVQMAMQQSAAKMLGLWGFAIGDAIFKHNIIPARKSTISPYQLWHRRSFDISRQPLLTFGCAVMAHVAVANQSKLSTNAELTYYVGPASSTHYSIMLYNKATKKTIIRRSFVVIPTSELDNSPTVFYESPYDYSDPIREISDLPSSIDQPRDLSSGIPIISTQSFGSGVESFHDELVVMTSSDHVANTNISTDLSLIPSHSLPLTNPPNQHNFHAEVIPELSDPFTSDDLPQSDSLYPEGSPRRSLRKFTTVPSYQKGKNPFVYDTESDSDEDGDIGDNCDADLSAYQATTCNPLPSITTENFQERNGHVTANRFTSSYNPSAPHLLPSSQASVAIDGSSIYIPKSILAVDRSPHKMEWLAALDHELAALKSNDTWESFTDKPDPHLIVPSQMIFDVRLAASGEIRKFKARLVARGDMQNFETYQQTFAETVASKSIHLILNIAAILDLHLFSFDVASAFLHSKIQEDVYMRRPKGLTDSHMEPIVKLRKCIYGLKQAAYEWRRHLHHSLISIGFVQNRSDACVYRKDEKGNNSYIILCTHVDDVLCASNSVDMCTQLQSDISSLYSITINNPLDEFLGMSITRDRPKKTIVITQPGYLLTLQNRFGRLLPTDHFTNPAPTPISSVFSPPDPVPTYLNNIDQKLYMSLVGSLMYASVMTRDDIKQSLSYTASAMKQATPHHMSQAIRTLSYLLSTPTLGRTFGGNSSGSLNLWATADASYACHNDRKSHFGITMHLGTNSGSFHSVSKKAKVMALSSTEAEYIALFEAGKLVAWARQFLQDLGFPQLSPTVIYEDNLSTIRLVTHGNDKGKTKHMDVRFHYIRELVESGKVQLEHKSTILMIADMLTKALPTSSFLRLRPFLLGTIT